MSLRLVRIAFVLLAWFAQDAFAESLDELTQAIRNADGEDRLATALDRACARVGTKDGFADYEALAQFFAAVPAPMRSHPLLLQRLGWAWMRAGRGEEGRGPLERARALRPEDPHTHAYLAECLRRLGAWTEARDALVAAASLGYDDPFLDACLTSVMAGARAQAAPKRTDALPFHAALAGPYLLVRPRAPIHVAVAAALAQDLARFETASPPLEAATHNAWARAAGEHALAAARIATQDEAIEPKLLHDLALHVRHHGIDAASRSLAYDLLAEAVRRAMPRHEGEPHRSPAALLDLAEAAIEDGRFALAGRLLRDRAALGYTPRIDRLAAQLPPDLDVP